MPYSACTHLRFLLQTLIRIDLSGNKIGYEGAKHLAEALRNNTVATILSCHIFTCTHVHFFTQTLSTLALVCDRIGSEGAKCLADALKHNTVTLILSR